MSRAKSNWPVGGQHLSHCPIGSPNFQRDRSREGHVIMYPRSRDVNFFHWQQYAKPRMRGLRVTARYCAGQMRMYTLLYPYMGIVSRDNVHNVNVTARVRRACIYPYMDIMYTHVTMYIHNVKVTARVRRAWTYSVVHIWVSCILTWQCIFTMLGLLRGSCICTWQRLSHPYMGIV